MDRFDDHARSLTAPAGDGAAITPSNTNALPQVTRAIYVGGTGDLRVDLASGARVTLAGVQGGTVLPLRAARVLATGTTASAIVALW